MPMKTDKLRRNSSKEAVQAAISQDIEMMMGEYKKTGKIGTSSPENEEAARKQAAAIAYANARRNAGGKVGKK